MFQSPLLKIHVTMDVYTQIPYEVPAHEMQALVTKHGASKIEVVGWTGDVVTVDDEDAEYRRVCRKHGMNPKTGTSWGEIAYGLPDEGRMSSIARNAMEKFAPDWAPEQQEIQEEAQAPKTQAPTRKKEAA